MDFKKYYLDEIMELEPTNNHSNSHSLIILNKYVKVILHMDEDNNLYYRCNVDDILKSNISNEELIDIRNNGWKYSSNKQYLIKNL